MTLIIASIRPRDVVITADGRSTTTTNGVITGVNDHFQKLFPIPDHPVVLANLGENSLDNKPLGEFVDGFARQLNAGNLSIEQMADELRRYAHPAIRLRLRSLGKLNARCGFWLVGFGNGDDKPRLVELFWGWKEGVLSCDERQFEPISIVEGGDGQKQVHPAEWTVEQGKTIEEVRDYHQSMMNEAINAKVAVNSVGGHVIELVITRDGWKWTRAPLPPDATQPGK